MTYVIPAMPGSSPLCHRLLRWSVVGLATLTCAGTAQATDPAPSVDAEEVVTGMADPGREEGDGPREVGNLVLFVPRNAIDYLFMGAEAAAQLITEEQLVPRYREVLGLPSDGTLFVFPTLFAETGETFDVGARFIANTKHVTTFQRFGFGGPRDVALESRAVFRGGKQLPLILSAEAFYELESKVKYYGVGLNPDRDPRNAFRPGTPHDHGLYKERQARGLGSLGLRWGPHFEFFLSSSISRRQVEDSVDVGDEALSEVFDVDTIPGTGIASWIGYGEIAARFDTRRERGGRPNPGVVAEGYTGGAHSTSGPTAAFMRIGWRLGSFLPVYRKTNIFASRAVFDRVVPLNGLEVPFGELPHQSEFRGFDTRRDNVSMVANLDYSWQLATVLGMRVFLDAATVAPSVAAITFEQVKSMRFAGGVGVDLYSGAARIANASLAGSPDGVRVLFSIGSPNQFGDRQHQD